MFSFAAASAAVLIAFFVGSIQGIPRSHLKFGSIGTTESNVVDLGYVQYRGNLTYLDTVAYLGLPYAEAPVGERRYRAPLALNVTRISEEAGGEVVNATEYPEFCIQETTGAGDAGGAGSEDCLKVNVYAPAGTKCGDDLPVLVYMHGGGYQYGNPRNWPFDHWFHQSPNVVIVSVYYRLGSFGFLAVPDFRDPSVGDFNVGFQDQTQALRWVQENIEAFGGDPKKVTINGQSAGGGSVELHLVATGQEGLFSGAIAQSVYRAPTPLPEQVQTQFDFFSKHAGCTNGTVTEKVACLRTASVSAISRAQDLTTTTAFNGGYKLFRPVVDGKIITAPPTLSLLAGNFAKVPVIVGSTSNETVSTPNTVEDGLRFLFPTLDDSDLEEFAEQYPQSDFSSASQRLQVATGESIFICAVSAIGNVFASVTNAWTYRYNQPNPTANQSLGTAHAAENWMFFNGMNTGFNGTGRFTPMTPTETAFAKELIAYWLSFVRSYDPNTYKLDKSPIWPRYVSGEDGRRRRVVLQQGPDNSTEVSGIFHEDEPMKEVDRCAFVIGKADKEQN
ncbi:alpha/beta-hydrolase [Dendrothele bispora CBS 962.96]|uniref:Carboxylic ester hydrolase n=1 Tax=Dendrothele bispora (strain CBS 962.96) TaxID=1314807 RepID=A0A4S8KSJ8_DENBC|nr:alpha/beta-hydrolase [Dendrothele bispora CBS 962.96]